MVLLSCISMIYTVLSFCIEVAKLRDQQVPAFGNYLRYLYSPITILSEHLTVFKLFILTAMLGKGYYPCFTDGRQKETK